jgi:putative two-component system response regulator
MQTQSTNSLEHELIDKTLGIEIPEPALPANAAAVRNFKTATVPFAAAINAGEAIQDPRILVIDDEAINVRVIQKCLQLAGYRDVETHTVPETALERIISQHPDVVICDVMMSVSGLHILQQVASSPDLRNIPMIMITASEDDRVRSDALELGAAELLTKPLRATSLLPRVRNALLLRSQFEQMLKHRRELESQIQARTAELMLSRLELIHCLAKLAEFRDNETGHHVVRVGRYAGVLARQMGFDRTTCELIEHAAPLHDIGKIGISDEILRKPGKLTPEEFETMQRHVGLGKRVFQPLSHSESLQLRAHTKLGEMMISAGSSPLLRMAAEIALTHHERWDGTGYPIGLKGTDIPVSGRIVAVADVFDALSSKRVYKPAFPIDKCFDILQEESGSHFDPEVVKAFMQCRSEIVRIRIEMADVD